MINKKYEEIIKAAEAGGEITKKYYGKILSVEGESMPCDFRTKADLESDKAIIKILSKAFPEYNIFSEESGETNKNSEYTFVIDPLDGTNNFVLGVPYFSTAIALMRGNEVIFGAIYNPVDKNMYYAEKGKGAYLNGKKIHVNNVSDLRNSSISIVVNYGFSVDNFMRMLAGLYKKDTKRVLTFWSVALDYCLLASGKIEALVLYKVPLYDFVAGKIIAKEAEAKITDLDGKLLDNDKSDIFLTTNGTKIHKEILEAINRK